MISASLHLAAQYRLHIARRHRIIRDSGGIGGQGNSPMSMSSASVKGMQIPDASMRRTSSGDFSVSIGSFYGAERRMDTKQRKELEDALAAALLLIYQGSASEALVHLNQTETEMDISPQIRQKLTAFAARRAQLIQDGTNGRLDTASAQDDAETAVSQAQSGIDQHNLTVLVPFMTRWASQQGLNDAYDSTPASDGSGRSATESTPWIWQKNTDYGPDDCDAAAGLSPAPRDDLEAAAGGPAPAHDCCACDEYPVN